MNPVLRQLASYATRRDGDSPPNVLQRLLVVLMIVAGNAILWFVYGIFAAIVLYLLVEFFGGEGASYLFLTVAAGLTIGLLTGGRQALDYWLHYDHPDSWTWL